jgi:hypothetical protein
MDVLINLKAITGSIRLTRTAAATIGGLSR